jgi:hypothetical protein
MKTMRKLRIVGLFVLLIAGLSAQLVQAQPGVNISFQTFYNDLSPYGRWTTSPQYGSIWTPYVDAGFQPYSTNGYWEVTEYGNTWVSDYDWGWAPFHYGRWSYDDYNGWFWIPGYEWGPAWVNWRSGGDYYGWAPLGPGMGINVTISIPSFWWVFVPQRYISYRNWNNYCVPRSRVTRVYNNTTIINNYYNYNNRNYAYGPRRDEIERVTRRSVPIRQIDVNQRGRVIVDRTPDRYNGRSNQTYSADRNNSRPDYNRPSGRDQGSPDNRGNERGRMSNENSNTDRYNDRGRSNENVRPAQPNAAPERTAPDLNNGRRNRDVPNGQPSGENNRNGGYERARRSAPDVRTERSAPAYNNENRRTERAPDYGNQGNSRRGNDAPAVRSERSAPESRGSSQPRERSSQGNPGGNERSSDRGGRGPR